MKRHIISAMIAVILGCFAALSSWAADIEPLRKQIDGWRSEVQQVQAAAQRSGTDSQQHFAQLIERLVPLQDQYATFEEKLTPAIANATARLAQLGPKPEDDAVELPGAAQDRAAIEQDLLVMDDVLKQFRLLVLETDQLITTLRDKKRAIATQSLFARTSGVFNLAEWATGIEWFARHIRGSVRVLSDGGRAFSEHFSAAHIVLLGCIGAFVSLLPFVRRFAQRGVLRIQKTYLTHAPCLSSFTAIVIYCAIPVVAVVGLVELAVQLQVLPGRFPEFIQILPFVTLCLFLARALTLWIFAPSGLLLMPSAGEQAVLSRTIMQMGCVHAFALLVAGSRILVDPDPHTLWLWQVVYALAGLGVMSLFFQKLGHAEDLREANNTVATESKIPNWQLLLRPCVVLVFLAISISLVTGYIVLANFIFIQSSIAVVLIITLWLVVRIVEEFSAPFSDCTSPTVRRISRTTGIPDTAIMRVAIMTSGVIQLGLLLFGSIFIVALWDGDPARILVNLQGVFSGFKVGNLNISFSAIAQSIALFVVIILAWRWVQHWVKQKVISHLPLEVGLKDSLDIMLGYAGLLLAFVLAFSSLGLSLDNIAVIAGALSVGIGFGLQSIVNNFVSGLILLAERPIKLGDWIVVGSDEGYVRKIKVRATEIETFDKATVIVPNSTLISGSVKNWMHDNLSGRAKIRVTVQHGTDPDLVKSILLAQARGHALIECEPSPKVFLTDITLNGLEFELGFLVNNVEVSHSVKSDLRLAVTQAFREQGVELAQSADVKK